ncbi:MAG: translation initiation factor IF-2 [Desulfobacteraceae bacterium]|nr:MAG: translation initiation factor IF-2 [Desulfobacteraceae bacterium]
MAKIRVYELARELNMQNKELLDKIMAMNIDVKSHMSALEDDDVGRIKSGLFGKPSGLVEETRIRPTIIRRRRKQVEPEQVEEPVELEAKADTPSIQEETALEEPEETAPEEEMEVEAVSEETAEAAEPEFSKEEALTEASAPPPGEERIEEAPVSEPEKPEEPAAKTARKKKEKRETPAKIIKLPVKPKIEPEAAVAKPVEVQREAPKAEKLTIPEVPPAELPPTDEEAKGKEKRKKRKKKEEEVQDSKFFKKKISFRHKEVIEGEDLYADIPRRGRKGGRKSAKAGAIRALKPQITIPKAIKRRVKIDDTIVLADLAKRMGIKANEMIAKLMSMGVMVGVNQTIDFETAQLVATEFDYELERAAFEEEALMKVSQDDPEKLTYRPPVVTIMGHVDHGKTSLLDVIRKSRVTEGEAGGITQHIGAYNVTTEKGQIVFLDTPGHEAFTAMRSRGAKVTDLVVLVVAADDGVMPQTIEAINHARAAGVPILVAVNKIDKANADPDRVQRELSEQGLVPEGWGGDTIIVKVSAKTHEGLNDLLEMILLQAEILELKANPDKLAYGHVVEAKLDAGRGPVATVLVREGTLRTGDAVVCGVHYGKVRAMLNDLGEAVETAGPSIPVAVIGLSGVPMAGDELVSLEDEKSAKQVSMHRIQKQRSKDLAKTSRLSLDGLYESLRVGETKDLNLILKADVNGSIEALRDSLTKLSNQEVKINVIHAATGTISESDVSLAAVSNATVIGFNVRPTPKVTEMANEEHVDMRFYNVIYEAIKDVQAAILGMMSSSFEEKILGRAEVREVFHIPKVGTIAGSYVTDGKIERGQPVRVLRDGVVSYEGKIGSLRRFKDDAKEVQSGYECGIGVDNFNDIKVGDVLECYYLEEIRPELGKG